MVINIAMQDPTVDMTPILRRSKEAARFSCFVEPAMLFHALISAGIIYLSDIFNSFIGSKEQKAWLGKVAH